MNGKDPKTSMRQGREGGSRSETEERPENKERSGSALETKRRTCFNRKEPWQIR